MEDTQVFYERFKNELNNSHSFPDDYAFKFIVKSGLEDDAPIEEVRGEVKKKLAQIQQIFDSANPQYSTKDSKNKKYTSLTVSMYALDADSIINYYKQVSEIEDIIML